MSRQPVDILELVRPCASSGEVARRRFQHEYGEDIYNFPVKIYGVPLEEAGDFYLYAFEQERIFSRTRTFEGRNSIQFRTFLSYYVLKHLFLEWRRTKKELDTISLSTPVGDPGEEGQVLEDVLPDRVMSTADDREGVEDNPKTKEIWETLTPEERLDLKLLSLLECDLGPEDVALLAQMTGRSIIDTLTLLDEVQDRLKR